MATSTTEVETIGDYAQLVALVNPIFVTRPYVSYLAGNAGLVTSLADLGAKIKNGTVTNNDYIDVFKDLRRVGYQTHDATGFSDGTWHNFGGGLGENVAGNYANVLKKNSERMVIVGNQYANTMTDTTNSDYLDGGKGNDYIYAGEGDDILIGGDGRDEIHGGADNDTIYGGRKDNVTEDNATDILYGEDGDDAIYGQGGNDKLDGGTGNDVLVGGTGSDELYGGDGDDVLIGNDGYGSPDTEADEMYGGTGYDTYITGDGDTISDEDGQGAVYFDGSKLTGGTFIGGDELYNRYEGDGGTYYLLKTNNTLIFEKNGKFLTIENFTKEHNDLEIVLNNKDIEISIFASTVSEKDGTALGAITLNQAYTEDVYVTLYTG